MIALSQVCTKQPALIDALQIHLQQHSALANTVNQVGLGEIARAASGDTFTVCDPHTNGVERCGAIRAATSRDQLAGELVALGLALLVVVLVGWIAEVFVKMAVTLVHVKGRQSTCAILNGGFRRTKRNDNSRQA